MPPKAATKVATKAAIKPAAGLTADLMVLLAIIKNENIVGIKWDPIAAAVNDGRSSNAIRQRYQKMRVLYDKATEGIAAANGGSDNAVDASEDDGAVKPVATKKKRAPVVKKGVAVKKTSATKKAPASKKRKLSPVDYTTIGEETEVDDEEVKPEDED